MMVEIIHLPRKLWPSNWRRFVQLDATPEMLSVLTTGRPVLVITGHFGNWELAGYALAMFGFKSYAIARPLDNPFLERFLRKFRERTGQKLLAKKGDLDRMEDILDAGGIVCTLGDQDAGQRGLYVDFFGRPASTHKAIALLALEHRAAMLVAGAYKIGDPLRYRLKVNDLILPEQYDNRPDAVRAITERYTAAFERLVREDVRQYFWLHRRWKHQPAKRKARAA
jgi:KDO2-lipid IV(A) lauroyltransferase